MTPIWANSGRLRVGPASSAEVAIFEGCVPGGMPKATLSRWMLLSLLRVQAGRFELVCVGVRSDTRRWRMTSAILRIQPGRRLLTSSGSQYELAAPYSGGPPMFLEDCVRHQLSVLGHEP